MAVIDYEFGISAIDTGFTRPSFDASHLIGDAGEYAFVDVGTSFSIPHLLRALADKGIAREQVRYVFLTHVHLDHAGGAGKLMAALPSAQAVVHPRGARHLIDPTRLIAATVEVYGAEKVRRVYGDILPIAAERVAQTRDGDAYALGARRLEVLHTEGHARHHYCLADATSEAVFSGDTFGVSYRELDTARGPLAFPAATPTEFDPQALHESIDRLLGLAPTHVYLTHYSRIDDVRRVGADLHTDIDAFVEIGRASCRERVYAPV